MHIYFYILSNRVRQRIRQPIHFWDRTPDVRGGFPRWLISDTVIIIYLKSQLFKWQCSSEHITLAI